MTLPFVPSAEVLPARPVTLPAKRLFRDRVTLPLLLLLTILGGVLRFTALDRPSIWGDEAATYGRVAGTYNELLNQLADSAFPPLHYELEWWIGQGMPYWGHFDPPKDDNSPRTFTPTKWVDWLVPSHHIRLTPFALRFVPAAAGTLFIPAVFFVAVQLFGRRVALISAFISCFSAYALVYSRDAKMYMHFWLAVTLHVGFALWWVRTRRPTAWALWVLSGVIAVGLHACGFVVLGLDVVIVFTSSKQNWRHLYTAIPATVWSATLVLGRVAGWVRLNKNWRQRRDWQKIAVWQRRAVRRFRWPVAAGVVVGVGMMLAAAFGPLGYYSSFSQQVQRVADHADQRNAVDLNELGIGWATDYNEGRQLPDFLLYTASAYLTGWEWPRHFPERGIDDQVTSNEGHAGTRMSINVRTLRLLQGGTIGLLGLLAIGLVPWRRAFSPARARLDRITQDNRVPKGFYRRRVLWLALWVTVVPWAFYTQSVSRVTNVFDGAAALVLKTVPDVEWPRAKRHPESQAAPATVDDSDTPTTWRQKYNAARAKITVNWQAARVGYGEITAALPAKWPAYAKAWRRDNVSAWKVALLGSVCLASLATVVYARRRIGWRTVRLILVVGLLILLSTVTAVLPKWVEGIPWMPRYLGVVLPAVFVLVAVLIDRQPKALRWVTLALFVAVNMSQFSARVWAGSEPPTGLMAADMIASQAKDKIPTQPERPTFRAYFQFGRFYMAEPGGGTLFTSPGRYYMRMLSGITDDLARVRFGQFEDRFATWKYGTERPLPPIIEDDLKRSPQIDRFVIWTAMAAGEVDQTDGVADRLKGQFKRVNDEIWQVRDHWRWLDRWQVRRRTYERIGGPTTQPAK